MAEWTNGKYVSKSGKVYDEAEERRKAQKFAQDALSGKSGKYVSASQTYNALVNANVPINKKDEPVAAGSGSGGGDSAVQLYLNELNRQRNERQAMLDEQYNQGKKNIEDAAEASNKDAYVAFMQGIKNMPQAAAMYGSGGMAQSLANKSQLNYENNRNKIAAAKLASLADLESDYRAGVLDAGDDYLTKLSAASGKSGSSGSKGTTGKVTTYQLGDTGVKASSELAMYNQLRLMGMSQQEAEDYLIRNGVISA